MFAAKIKPEKENMKDTENDTQTIYRTAKQMKQENKDICINCITEDIGMLIFNEEEKKRRGNSIMKD